MILRRKKKQHSYRSNGTEFLICISLKRLESANFETFTLWPLATECSRNAICNIWTNKPLSVENNYDSYSYPYSYFIRNCIRNAPIRIIFYSQNYIFVLHLVLRLHMFVLFRYEKVPNTNTPWFNRLYKRC